MGGAGDARAPVGDPPTGTAAGNVAKRPCPFFKQALSSCFPVSASETGPLRYGLNKHPRHHHGTFRVHGKFRHFFLTADGRGCTQIRLPQGEAGAHRPGEVSNRIAQFNSQPQRHDSRGKKEPPMNTQITKHPCASVSIRGKKILLTETSSRKNAAVGIWSAFVARTQRPRSASAHCSVVSAIAFD